MKANCKPRDEDVRRNGAFTFIVPMTMAIVIGFAMLTIGAYIIGTISSTLEDSFPQNTGDGDYRSAIENKTITLLGNISDGFSDVVDIEIVVIIITALSMAILAIMAVGSKKSLF